MKTITGRPIMVAVGGDSGTGKTTLVSGLYRIFGSERITNICLDDYHRLDRAARRRAGVTALDPAANRLTLMAEHIEALRRGETIRKPTYDHSTGTFGPEEDVRPREIVVIRGLFPLYNSRLRAAFDVRVWLEPQEELKWSWKVKRDCAQRGYSVPEVIRQIVERRDDVQKHIQPQRAQADLVVEFHPPSGYFVPGTLADHDDAHLNVRLHLGERLPALDLDDVLAAAAADGRAPAIRLTESSRDNGGRWSALEIDGTVSPDHARQLDERIWSHIESHHRLRPDDIGGYLDGTSERHSDALALTQLLVAYQVVRAGLGRAVAPGGTRLAAAALG
jgi:phosphoribulokinase